MEQLLETASAFGLRYVATIIAATSQEYKNKEGSAEIGATVKSRSKYALLTELEIACNLFAIFGDTTSAADVSSASSILEQYQNPMGLLLLIPTAVVIIMAN